MLRRIAALTVLISLIAVAHGLFAQGREGRGRGLAPATPPPLFFKEAWQITGPAHAMAAGENVLTNANLELKLYGPSATAADPDKRIWISTPPTNI